MKDFINDHFFELTVAVGIITLFIFLLVDIIRFI